jgi:putative endonuclease
MNPPKSILTGKLGEDKASDFLVKAGYSIIERNFQKKHGDIDIIAKDGDTYVFIEVKTRNSDAYGSPEEYMTPRKIYTLTHSVQYYCYIRKLVNVKMRIDLITLILKSDLDVEKIDHFKNISS